MFLEEETNYDEDDEYGGPHFDQTIWDEGPSDQEAVVEDDEE